MYGFKMYAFQEAFNRGYTSVIWLDTPTVLHKPIDEFFDILEANKNGELVVATQSELYKYVNNSTLEYYNLTREQVKEAGWLLNYGFIFGFTKDSETYQKMFAGEKAGLFTSAEQDWQAHLNRDTAYDEHRHEESILSLVVQIEGRKLIPLWELQNFDDKHLSFEKTAL